MQAVLVLVGLFAVRIAIPVAIVLFLGYRQAQRSGPAF